MGTTNELSGPLPLTRQDGKEEWADVPRYLAALRRGTWLMVLIVVPLTLVVLLLSLVLPKTYEATARVALQGETGTTRQLETYSALLGSTSVLSATAERFPGESADT